jgi:hypothetical protein
MMENEDKRRMAERIQRRSLIRSLHIKFVLLSTEPAALARYLAELLVSANPGKPKTTRGSSPAVRTYLFYFTTTAVLANLCRELVVLARQNRELFRLQHSCCCARLDF